MEKDDAGAALEALLKGIRAEIEGRNFYREVAQRVTDPGGQRMLLSLAGDEEEHLHILSVQYESLNQGGSWVNLDEAKGKELAELSLRLFPQDAEAAERMVKPEMSDLDALKLGMEIERRGYEMYIGASESGAPDARAMYRYLAGEESKHFAILQKTHDYLDRNGWWFFWDLEKPLAEP